MNKDYEYYERKVRDLVVENSVLRDQLANSSRLHNTTNPKVLLGNYQHLFRSSLA